MARKNWRAEQPKLHALACRVFDLFNESPENASAWLDALGQFRSTFDVGNEKQAQWQRDRQRCLDRDLPLSPKFDDRELFQDPLPPWNMRRDYTTSEAVYALTAIHEADGSLGLIVPADGELRESLGEYFRVQVDHVSTAADDSWVASLERVVVPHVLHLLSSGGSQREIAGSSSAIAVATQTLDGPAEPFTWLRDGSAVGDQMQAKAWRVANHLWSCNGKWASFGVLAPIANDDHGDDEYDATVARGQRDAANAFFERHDIGWRVGIKQNGMRLHQPKAGLNATAK